MKEFITGICWQEFYTTNQLQANTLNNAGFRMLRIFFNLCDVPYIATPNQTYIKNLFASMPNPMHAWTFEGHASVNTTTEPMRASFDFCKKYNWLPIVCMGYQEELPHNWLGRVPSIAKFDWLAKFVKEFAIYLKTIYGFNRADLEVWNEPSKCMGVDYYCNLSLKLAIAWKTISNYKVHVFADDLLRTDYLNAILTRADLMNKVDYISTHIGVGSEDEEWDRGLIQIVKTKIARYPHLKQALSESSVNGTWSRLNQLPNNVAMYGLIGAIRNIEFGTATRIDDIWMWDRAGNLTCTSPTKAQILKDFNNKYYIPYILESEDMEFNIVKPGSINDETRAVQEVLSKSGYGIVATGKYDTATGVAIKEFQTEQKITVDGKAGSQTWDKLISECASGLEEFCQLIRKKSDWR